MKLLTVSAVAIVLFFSNLTSFAQIDSDEFNSGSLSSFWRFMDPLSDATHNQTGTHAQIVVPAGLSHEPRQFHENFAPRLAQEIAAPGTDFGAFTVYAKFDATMNAMYQLVGIEAIQDNSNYLRAELFSDGTNIYPLIWSFTDAGSPEPSSPVIGSALPSGTNAPLLIKLQRAGTTFTVSWATPTSSTWTVGATLEHTMNVDSLGVYIGNSDGVSGTSAPAFTGTIDYFTIFDPLVAPVQLGSFTATVMSNDRVKLDWMTVSETNNFGFNVQKSAEATQNFVTLENSFVAGHGTTIAPNHYSITVASSQGRWYYRLEQIDLDGTRNYSDPVQVDVVTAVGTKKVLPTSYEVDQNYPNPFNPSTIIKYSLPQETRVRLEVFNLIGQKVATILDAVKGAGVHEIKFDAVGLTSGVYIYKMSAGAFSSSRRMVLMR